MAKGFGTQPDKQLGYILDLLPEVGVYAAKFSLDAQNGEPFIGIMNILKDAQVWKDLKSVKQAIELYADFLFERSSQKSECWIAIKRSHTGQMTTENVEAVQFLLDSHPFNLKHE